MVYATASRSDDMASLLCAVKGSHKPQFTRTCLVPNLVHADLQDITEMGGGELILSPSTGSAVAQPINIRSLSIPTSNSFGSR